MMEQAKRVNPNPDVILITGDYLGHGLSSSEKTNKHYEEAK
jgi:hypothetical protein